MARRRRPEGVTFAACPHTCGGSSPKPGSIPATTRPLGSRGAALTGCRSSTCALAERAERLRLVGFDDPVRSFPADGEPEGDGDD